MSNLWYGFTMRIKPSSKCRISVLNGQPLQQSSPTPQEFTGAVIVPAAGMDVLLEVSLIAHTR